MKENKGLQMKGISLKPRWTFVLIALTAVMLLFFTTAHSSHAEEPGPPGEKTQAHLSHSEHGSGGKLEGDMSRAVHLSPEVVVRSGIRTEPVQYRNLVREIQTVGEITYDERGVKVVSAWVGGRVDKLYVNFTGVTVKKGDPLAELYSPELLSTQEEYLIALKTKKEVMSLGSKASIRSATSLANAARERLFLWGITEEQIARLEKTGKVSTHMTIHAPIEGIVIHKKVLEGQYVKTGNALYTIADLSVVWALADIYEYELDWVKVGQKVSISTPTCPGVPFTGKVSFIDPFLNLKTRSVKVRMDVVNPKCLLKPGMFVDTRLKVPYADRPVLSIPYTALLDTGVRKVVYVEMSKGEFMPVEVRVGPRAGRYLPVLSGLKEGQQIAVSGNYLIDSQSTLGAGASGAYGGALHGGHGH
ncbi:MAG: efflux RND transporter periplasmic adaptor subunit [Deltaproteobacteria bacterium]|nr:MAG: efflux RND transporter periplasmic adaptor subunit [Deltaproteobacteria bacterium]